MFHIVYDLCVFGNSVGWRIEESCLVAEVSESQVSVFLGCIKKKVCVFLGFHRSLILEVKNLTNSKLWSLFYFLLISFVGLVV